MGQSVGDLSFVAHETVEVYSNSEQRWVLAEVVDLLPDGGVLVRYKDGDLQGEKAIPGEYISSSNSVIRKAVVDQTFAIGETVEVYSNRHNNWVVAEVFRFLPDGGVLVRYKDDLSEKAIPREYLSGSSSVIRKTDEPGMYTVIAPACVDDGTSIASTEIGGLETGAVVRVLEVVTVPDESRVRGRIERPPGWISLLNTDTGMRLATKATALRPGTVEACPHEVAQFAAPASQALHPQMKQQAQQLYMASQNGHTEVVQALIRTKADVERADADGATPLLASAQFGHTEVLHLLIAAKGSVNTPMNDGSTPLLMSAQSGHIASVRCLLVAKAEIEKPDDAGATPIFVSAENGHVDVVHHLIISKVTVDKPAQDGQTPVSAAAQSGHDSVVQTLITYKADVHRPTNDGAWTPLKLAKHHGHTGIVQMLARAGSKS